MQPGHNLFTSQWVTVDGLRLHARVAVTPTVAAGLPIVMMHGMAVSHRYLMPTAEHLAPYAPVYVPDHPGFGLSDDPDHVLDFEELADWLERWMVAIGLERAAFVANSTGCQIVASLGVRAPNRVACAVLVGPTMDPAARTAHQQIGRWLWDGRHEPPAVLPIILRDFLDVGPRRLIGTLRHALRHHIEALLPLLPMPVLVVRGTRDPIAPEGWARTAVSLLPRGRLVQIPGAPHNTNFAAARQLARVVLTFLGIPRHQGQADHQLTGGRGS